jgi:hypothetical protein
MFDYIYLFGHDFDTHPVYKVNEAIEELTRQEKTFVLDCLLDGLLLHEHYKERACKQKPNYEFITAIKTFQDTLKRTTAHEEEAAPDNPAASSTSSISPSGTL